MSSKISTQSLELADSLHSVAIHLLRKLRREDDSSGLNAPRLSALSVIVFGGPVTLRDLARAEQVQPPTMTRIVHALEDLGLVLKTPDTRDARSSHISPTPAGRKLLLKGRERRVRSLAKQIAGLQDDEMKTLHAAAQILSKLVRAL